MQGPAPGFGGELQACGVEFAVGRSGIRRGDKRCRATVQIQGDFKHAGLTGIQTAQEFDGDIRRFSLPQGESGWRDRVVGFVIQENHLGGSGQIDAVVAGGFR